jgi:hypothetical protein
MSSFRSNDTKENGSLFTSFWITLPPAFIPGLKMRADRNIVAKVNFISLQVQEKKSTTLTGRTGM